MTSYADFLDTKRQANDGHGFAPYDLPDYLFPFQRDLVDWSIRQGRAAIFADCGLGKTPMQLAWADNVARYTGKPVLFVTPLAVTFQAAREAEKFGVDAAISRDGSIPARVVITNYERLEHFTPDDFGGVVCDESSAIKAYDGQRRAIVTEFLRTMPYRLLGTATAAPNDYIELGTASEALGELGYMDMLNRYFVNDNQTSDVAAQRNRQSRWLRGSAGSGWRFKGHAVDPFWKWVSSWARAIRKPSDYGYDDGSFILPDLDERVTVVEARTPNPDMLFDLPAIGLSAEREELRRTIDERCEAAASHLDGDDLGIAWCHLNDEAKRLTRLIDGAVEVSGSEPVESKEEKLHAFSDGQIRVLVTKPAIGAWGLNWQHVNRMTYFPSHSYEQYYQAVRRCWRFGQTRPVTVDVITTEGGKGTLKNLQAKSARADAMFAALIEHMNAATRTVRAAAPDTAMETPPWLT